AVLLQRDAAFELEAFADRASPAVSIVPICKLHAFSRLSPSHLCGSGFYDLPSITTREGPMQGTAISHDGTPIAFEVDGSTQRVRPLCASIPSLKCAAA